MHAGLWTWTEPGLFAVPPIGIIGWAYFAGAAMACLDGARPVAAMVVAPLVTHVLLVASWWAAFKWLSRPLPPWPFVVAAWIVLGASRPRGLARRVPGSGDSLNFAKICYFVDPERPSSSSYCVLYGRDLPSLVVYALAFVARRTSRFCSGNRSRSRIKSCVALFMARSRMSPRLLLAATLVLVAAASVRAQPPEQSPLVLPDTRHARRRAQDLPPARPRSADRRRRRSPAPKVTSKLPAPCPTPTGHSSAATRSPTTRTR